MAVRIAVMGATSNVGREILQVLSESGIPHTDVTALAADRSVGGEASFGEDDTVPVGDIGRFDFRGVDIVYSALPEEEATIHVPRAAEAGAVVIDTGPRFRMEPDVPMVAANVNPKALARYGKRNIVATPSTITLMVAEALSPLHDAFSLVRTLVTTYQSVSAEGRPAMDELFNQTRGIYVNEPVSSNQTEFVKQIAFNVIPTVGEFEKKGGATTEEAGLAREAVKLFGADMRLHANCAVVPVFVGHSAFINIECEEDFNEDQLKAAWRKSEGVSVVDHREPQGVVTPAETPGEDAVFISRVRLDTTIENGASFWLTGDNLRRSAVNAVRVGQLLAAEYLGK